MAEIGAPGAARTVADQGPGQGGPPSGQGAWRPLRLALALARIDARGVGRDPLLRWLIGYPLALALIMRWGVPAIAGPILARSGVSLLDYGALLTSFMVELLPVLIGMIVGFLLLDERDDGTLLALQVTPLTLGGYLAYRVTLPIVVSVIMTMVTVPLVGLVPVTFGPLLVIALGAAPLAPLFALFLAAFARNKVEGFALTKASGVLFVPPVAAYFVAPPWQWAFGVFPTFWPVKAFWVQQGVGGAAGGPAVSAPLVLVAIGIVVQAGMVWLLLRRFRRVMSV